MAARTPIICRLFYLRLPFGAPVLGQSDRKSVNLARELVTSGEILFNDQCQISPSHNSGDPPIDHPLLIFFFITTK